MKRPNKISTAVTLLWITLTLAILSNITQFSNLSKSATTYNLDLGLGFMILILISILAFFGFLIYSIGKGKNWARITYLILFMIGILYIFSRYISFSILLVIYTILQITAIFLLFQAPSSKWFRWVGKQREKHRRKQLVVDISIVSGIIILFIIGFMGVMSNSMDYYLLEQYSNPEQAVKDGLGVKGYEVLEVGYVNGPFVDMKSLGNREDQVWAAIWALMYAYPEPEDTSSDTLYAYRIRILEPTRECFYSTYITNFNSWVKASYEGKVYVNEDGKLDGLNFDKVVEHYNEQFNQEFPASQDLIWETYIKNYPEVDATFLHSLVKYQIMDSENCE